MVSLETPATASPHDDEASTHPPPPHTADASDPSPAYVVDTPPLTTGQPHEAATPPVPVKEDTVTQTSSAAARDSHVAPSSPQQTDNPPPTLATPAPPPQRQANGLVAELQDMFPNIDVGVLEVVLEAHGNDISQCISALLAMSDPNYKATPQDTVDGDEALARRLAAEDDAASQIHHGQSWQLQGAGQDFQPYQQQSQYGNLPYQARVRPPHGQTGMPPQGPVSTHTTPGSANPGWQPGLSQGGKDEIQKLQEEFTRFAGVGKKAMADWFGKAKAKVAELQAARSEQNQIQTAAHSSSSQNQSTPSGRYSWGGTGPTSSQTPLSKTTSSATNTGSTRTTRSSGYLPHASRYDPQPGTTSASNGARPVGAEVPTNSQSSALAQGGGGQRPSIPLYDATGNNAVNMPAAGTTRMATPGGDGAAKVAGAAAVGAGVGLASGAISQRDEDEDSLEYTRNPFEDDD